MDNRQVFIQRIADIQVFVVDVFVVSISPLMTLTCVLFVVLFYLILFKKRKEKLDKDCLLRYSRSRFFFFFSFLEDN